jgi:sterol desaturase/sphingolipid hydroxylase (fatty acid hydroxylase superfamily)
MPLLDPSVMTHGVPTFVVLLCGWVVFCSAIELSATLSPSVMSSKLQAREKTHDPEMRTLATRTTIRNWIVVLVQSIAASPVLARAFPRGESSNMTVVECATFFLIWFVTNDFLFTIFHACFHKSPWLYQVVHKEHHAFRSPFVWMSHSMSVGELSANGVAVMAYPLVHALVLKQTTPLELVWSVQLVSQLIGCVEHSGYGALCPLVLVDPKRFPAWLFSTTKHHDDHHQYFHGNYGGYLAIWDALMGTTIKRQTRENKHA